jgi:hypothetical protein
MKKLIFSIITLGVFMLIGFVYGFMKGNIGNEMNMFFSMPWAKVMVLDIYIGFVIFSIWIYFREQNNRRFLMWFLPLLFIGNLIAIAYIINAIFNSKNNTQKLMFGNYKKDLI